MIKPEHLEKIYHPTDDEGMEGEIVCECEGSLCGLRNRNRQFVCY